MASFEKVKNWLLNRQDEEPYTDPPEAEYEPEPEDIPAQPSNYTGRRSNVTSIHAATTARIMIEKPQDFEGARKIVDHLKTRRPVVINIESKDVTEAQRLVDFISGAVYAVDGHIQKVARGIFVLAPNNVDISLDEQEEDTWSKYYTR